jgi:hypothetical protein
MKLLLLGYLLLLRPTKQISVVAVERDLLFLKFGRFRVMSSIEKRNVVASASSGGLSHTPTKHTKRRDRYIRYAPRRVKAASRQSAKNED